MKNNIMYFSILVILCFLDFSCISYGPIDRLSEDKTLAEENDSILLIRLQIVQSYDEKSSPGFSAPTITFLSAKKQNVYDVDFPFTQKGDHRYWNKKDGIAVYDELLFIKIESGKYKTTGINLYSLGNTIGYRSPYVFTVQPDSITYFGQWIFDIDKDGKFKTGVKMDKSIMEKDIKLFTESFPLLNETLKTKIIAAELKYDSKILGFSDE